jgi:hypothetical protein
MMNAADTASGGIICVPDFMTIGSGFEATLNVLPERFEKM